MIGEIDFERFVAERADALVRYCSAIICGGDAEDAAQEAFIRLWKNLHKCGSPEEASAYLYRAAYSACIDILRAKKLFRAPPTAPPTVQSPSAVSERLDAALKTLKPADRAILYERAAEEKSYTELAAQFGRSETWVRKRYSIAKNKLNKLLSEDYGGEKQCTLQMEK